MERNVWANDAYELSCDEKQQIKNINHFCLKQWGNFSLSKMYSEANYVTFLQLWKLAKVLFLILRSYVLLIYKGVGRCSF